MKKLTVLVTLLGLLALGWSISMAQTSSQCGVEPELFVASDEYPGGNVRCDQLGEYEFTTGRIEDDRRCGDTSGPISWSTDEDCTYVNWSFDNGSHCGLAIIVKGGPNANVYKYDDDSCQSDAGLASPINPSGNPAELSNITFCWNVCDEKEAEWCSPGYWKNHPDEADVAAAACELDMDETTYSSQFGSAPPRSPKGVSDNAPTEPTLREVLDNPQWYGGGAANNVGDLLSECHPDVDFQGERVEDSCPLN